MESEQKFSFDIFVDNIIPNDKVFTYKSPTLLYRFGSLSTVALRCSQFDGHFKPVGSTGYFATTDEMISQICQNDYLRLLLVDTTNEKESELIAIGVQSLRTMFDARPDWIEETIPLINIKGKEILRLRCFFRLVWYGPRFVTDFDPMKDNDFPFNVERKTREAQTDPLTPPRPQSEPIQTESRGIQTEVEQPPPRIKRPISKKKKPVQRWQPTRPWIPSPGKTIPAGQEEGRRYTPADMHILRTTKEFDKYPPDVFRRGKGWEEDMNDSWNHEKSGFNESKKANFFDMDSDYTQDNFGWTGGREVR